MSQSIQVAVDRLSFSANLASANSAIMPYATRKMVQYMKDHGMSKVDESSSAGSADGEGSKKIRELPSSVDPGDDESSSAKKSSADGGSKTGSKPKSSSSGAGSKSKSKSSSTGSKSGKPKSTASSSSSKASSSSKSKSKSAASGSKTSKSSKSKKSSSGQSVKSGKSSSGGKSKSKVKVEIVSATAMALKPVVVSGMNYNEMPFDEKKVQFLQSMLKSNLKSLKDLKASEPYESAQKQFGMYSIEDKKPLERKPHSAKALYECTHKSFPKECLVVAKVYDAKGAYDANKSLYLKVLRHLGKKHPNIIQTWDVIAKDGSVYVFQELAPYGNMDDYMSKKGALTEAQTQDVAKQVRLAMDFLGDMGVVHRSICPRHVLLLHKDMRVKLTGFRSALVYYNTEKDDLNYQPCIALSKRGKGEDYQAPEVYGSDKKEKFDPVAADVFSAGATLYHLLTAKYPYDSSKNNPKIEDEIQGNVRALKVSDNAKSALGFMLTTESTKRFTVERLKEHPWFHEK